MLMLLFQGLLFKNPYAILLYLINLESSFLLLDQTVVFLRAEGVRAVSVSFPQLVFASR